MKLPKRIVVTQTRVRAVVIITSLFSISLPIVNTKPNAMAPLIEPA